MTPLNKSFYRSLKIVEVGPRDGLQNARPLSVEQRAVYVKKLVNAGIKHIEFGSFVSPKIKQMSDSDKVIGLSGIKPNVNYIALVPTKNLAWRAINAGATELAVFTTISDTFSQKNTNCSIDESLQRIYEIIQVAKNNNIPVRGYISCVMGCPYEGYNQDHFLKTIELSEKLVEMGAYEISLGDTIGVGDPIKTDRLIRKIRNTIGIDKVAVHFHNTYGRGLLNVYVALNQGVNIIDSSSGGLGGCPFARGATGNIATEDVVDLLDKLNIYHGINMNELQKASNFIFKQLGKKSNSLVLDAINNNNYKVNYEEY